MAEFPDAPETVLAEHLAQLLDDTGLAVYQKVGAIPERGIRIDGGEPTSVDEYTMITPLPSIADGRAGMTYRVQFFTRRRGGIAEVRAWAAQLRAQLDHRAYVPQVLGISWSEEFSSTDFEPDTQGRAAVAATYNFRGRRP